MNLEIRADGAHICGYVNVPGKISNPISTAHGIIRETIEPGAFQRAIDRASDTTFVVDHGDIAYASTAAGTLRLYEDSVGLYADACISDEALIQEAKADRLRGWSFSFQCLKDVYSLEGGYKLRTVQELELTHVSVIIRQWPCYNATSVEFRDGCTQSQSKKFCNAAYQKRLDTVKLRGSRYQ